MMTERIKSWGVKVAVVCFLLLLALPTIQRTFRIFPTHALSDVDTKVKKPQWSWGAFQSGRFQKVVDDWMLRGSGFWGYFVAISNTINYWLFDVAPPGYGGVVVIGKDKSLFNSMSINDYNGKYYSDPQKAMTLLEQAKVVQEYLASKGIPFLLVISPNKLLLHPEWMRSALASPQPTPRLFPQARAALVQSGVHHLVLADELTEARRYAGMKFFPKSGAHMNKLGTCLAASAITRELNKQLPHPLPSVDCGEVTTLIPPSADDRDLARILNVLDTSGSLDLQPAIQPALSGKGELQNTLFVGTSNLFGFIGTMRDLGLLNQRDYYFYSRNMYSCSKRNTLGEQRCSRRPIRKKHDYGLEILDGRSAVIVETPEARFHQMGFSFLEKLSTQIEAAGQLARAAGESQVR
jgi:hypothetical protein